jgi:hypothetical protein
MLAQDCPALIVAPAEVPASPPAGGNTGVAAGRSGFGRGLGGEAPAAVEKARKRTAARAREACFIGYCNKLKGEGSGT